MDDLFEGPVKAEPAASVAPAASPAPGAAAARRPQPKVFAGLTMTQLLLCVLGFAVAVWALWVTQAVLHPKQTRFVRADLSRIVGDYVQAQARSAAPPERVEAEMRRFMTALEAEITRRGTSGEVVLVGEAVLSKNVPDVTAAIAGSVYGSGVPRPQPASAAQMQAVEAARAAMPAAAPAPTAPLQPSGGFGPAPVPQQPPMATGGLPGSPAMPGASATVFGGGDGSGR